MNSLFNSGVKRCFQKIRIKFIVLPFYAMFGSLEKSRELFIYFR